MKEMKNILLKGLNKHMKIEHRFSRNKEIGMSLKVEHMHLSGVLGRVHAGTFTTLSDTCIGYGAMTHLPKDATNFAVLASSTNFVKFGKIRDVLECTATQTQSGKKIQIWDAVVQCEGKVLSTTRATVLNLYEPIENNDKMLGLIFSIKDASKYDIAQKFDAYSMNWEEYVEFGRYNIFSWIANSLKNTPEQNQFLNILDLACGIGLVAKCLRENGCNGKITGSDISNGMIEKAMRTGHYNGGILKLDLDEKIPLIAKYNLITCFGATELLVSVDVLLEEVRRLLDGEFWVSFQFNDEKFNPTEHQGLKGFTENEIRQKLTSFGFEILELTIEKEAYFTTHPTTGYSPVPYILIRCK